jgi:voltage-gated potassium channel
MGNLSRRFAYLGGLILLTLGMGTAGFMIIERWNAFDSFYMTLFTITTVGYMEVHELSRAGRIFNSFVIFFGVTTMFLGIGLTTQTAIELELAQYFGKRRIKNMIEKLRGHYIVCGFGRVGRGAAEELARANVPFIVVDNKDERVTRALQAGYLAVLADATRDATLRDVGIDRAAGLIATLASDADNLFVILSAKELNQSLTLCARVSEEETEQKMRRAGAHHVFAPYNITGHRMAQAMLRPHVSQFIDFTTKDVGLNVGMEQLRVSEHSELANKTLAQMQVRRELGVIVLAVRKPDGTMQFNPPADATITEGDYLIVMGNQDNLQRLERLLSGSVRA